METRERIKETKNYLYLQSNQGWLLSWAVKVEQNNFQTLFIFSFIQQPKKGQIFYTTSKENYLGF